jgi:hypothetical protein
MAGAALRCRPFSLRGLGSRGGARLDSARVPPRPPRTATRRSRHGGQQEIATGAYRRRNFPLPVTAGRARLRARRGVPRLAPELISARPRPPRTATRRSPLGRQQEIATGAYRRRTFPLPVTAGRARLRARRGVPRLAPELISARPRPPRSATRRSRLGGQQEIATGAYRGRTFPLPVTAARARLRASRHAELALGPRTSRSTRSSGSTRSGGTARAREPTDIGTGNNRARGRYRALCPDLSRSRR